MPKDFAAFVTEHLPHAKVTKLPFGGINIAEGSGTACDFCSTVFPRDTPLRVYEANDVWIDPVDHGDVPPYRSIGDWGACEPCAALIDAGDRKALHARSLDLFCERHGSRARTAGRDSIQESHDAFFRART